MSIISSIYHISVGNEMHIIELSDIDSESESEKNESEKKVKNIGSEKYFISSLSKDNSDIVLLNSLYDQYNSNWCTPEIEIITPPPEI